MHTRQPAATMDEVEQSPLLCRCQVVDAIGATIIVPLDSSKPRAEDTDIVSLEATQCLCILGERYIHIGLGLQKLLYNDSTQIKAVIGPRQDQHLHLSTPV